jgi:imidazolonepropionase-like amidohydrolase
MLRNFIYTIFLIIQFVFFQTLFSNIEPITNLQENQPNVFALTHAKVYINPIDIIEDATIVIRGKRIESVGKDILIPHDAYEIDLTNKIVYPGFIDSWFEYAQPDSLQNHNSHWNSKVHPEFNSGNSPEISKKQLNDFYLNGITSVHIVPTKGIFRGNSTLRLLNSEQQNLENSPTQVLAFETFGWGADKYPGSLLGTIALLRQTFYDVLWYKRAKTTYNSNPQKNQPIQLNISLQAIQSHLDNNGSFIFRTGDEVSTLRAFNIAEEFGLNLWIKSKGYEYRRLDEFKNKNSFFVLPLNFQPKPKASNHQDALSYSTTKLKHWIMAPKNPTILDEANIPFSFTSDGLKKKMDFRNNLINIVQNHGLLKQTALKALTIHPAKKLGLENQLGQINEGFLANLVVVSGDYFDKKSIIESVWITGEEHKMAINNSTQFTGSWSFSGFEKTGELSFTKKGGKLKFDKISLPLKNIIYSLNQVSFTTSLDTMNIDKISQFIGNIENNKLIGSISLLNGSTSNWTATKIADVKEVKKQYENHDFPIPILYPEGAYGLEKRHQQPKIVLVKNAIIWTSSKEGILKNMDLLIRNGLIHNISPNITPPENAVVINARGKHISPGLIDCHSHSAASAINEGTQSVTSEVRIRDVLDSDDIAIYRELAGGLTIANILHGSANAIGGQNAVIKLRWGQSPENLIYKKAPQGIKFALGENVKQSNWGDDYTTRYPQTRMGVEQVIRDAFDRAIEYQKQWQDYNQKIVQKVKIEKIPPRRDLELDALVEILIGKRKIHCHSYRQDEILMLSRIADDYGFTIGTFQHVLEGYKVADRIAEHGAGASTFSDWWAYKFEVIDAIPYNGALMHEVGVTVSFNSDSDELARRMNLESAKAVKYGGINEEEALKFVTINPAIQLGIDQWVGSLEIGKEADFVIWSGHPLSTMSKCEQTWIDGTQYFSIEEDLKLRKRDEKWRSEIIQYILSDSNPTSEYLKPDTGHSQHEHRCLEGVER